MVFLLLGALVGPAPLPALGLTTPHAPGFRSVAAPRSLQQQLVLAVIGDYGCQATSTCPTLSTQQESSVASMVHTWNPGDIVAVGDNSYEHGCGPMNPPDTNCPAGSNDIQPDQQLYLADINNGTFYEVVGNHDAEHIQNVISGGSGPNCPSPSNCGYVYNRPSHYVAHLGGGLLDLFVTDMNANDPDGDSATSKQAQQYLSDVGTSSAIWKITADHQAFYSSGRHGTFVYTHWAIVPQIDLFLSGHDHDLEHLTYQGKNYVVSGVGGKELYTFGTHPACPFTGVTGVSDCPATTVWRDAASPTHFGAVRLTITPSTLTVEFVAVSSTSASGTVLHSFTLSPSGTIAGTVTDTLTHKAIAGATISAAGVTTSTNSSGAYTLGNLPIGSTTVAASATGYSPATQVVVVSAGSTMTQNFSLPPLPGTIGGTVVDANTGVGISGASVSFSGGSATTGSSGGYSLSGLVEGTYTFTASAAGFGSQSQVLSVTPGATLQQNFALPEVITTSTSVSTQQYQLAGNDGSTWVTMDATNLVKSVTPSVNSTAILGGNVDLWTNSPGYNQDVGLFVSDNVGADQLVAWKESGGFVGTFSPNAAFVQSVYPMTAGHTYVFKLKWKTNKPEPGGVTIFAAAGGAATGFSPTRLTAEVLPAGANPYTTVSTQQYTLSGNDGSTWVTMDATNLVKSVTPSVDSTAILGGNVDLWTNTGGYNQDVAIFVSDNGGADQLLAWKESGGFAGTFSPNAAFVQSVFSMTAGHTYVFKLQWKTNKPEPGGVTIFAAAGGAATGFSPTRLTAEVLPAGPNPYTAVSTQQYTLAGNDGSTWMTMDVTNLVKSVTPSVNSTAILGGNVDLWTNSPGYNQDVGLFASDNGGADQLLAWKESGGFAGTFSPNAAFVQTMYPMTAGHTYTFKLKWKTNKPEPAGVTIFAGAGGPAPFSPTRLTVEITS